MKLPLKIWIQGRLIFAIQLLVVVLIAITAVGENWSTTQQLEFSIKSYLLAMLIEALFTAPQIGFHAGLLELLKGESKRKADIMVITVISTSVLLYTSSCLMIFFLKKIEHLKPVLQNPLFYQLTAISILISLINVLLQRNSIYKYCNTPISINIKHFSK